MADSKHLYEFVCVCVGGGLNSNFFWLEGLDKIPIIFKHFKFESQVKHFYPTYLTWMHYFVMWITMNLPTWLILYYCSTQCGFEKAKLLPCLLRYQYHGQTTVKDTITLLISKETVEFANSVYTITFLQRELVSEIWDHVNRNHWVCKRSHENKENMLIGESHSILN